MQRFGGKPYWDGRWWRCPDCNGFTERHQDLDICTVCERYAVRQEQA